MNLPQSYPVFCERTVLGPLSGTAHALPLPDDDAPAHIARLSFLRCFTFRQQAQLAPFARGGGTHPFPRQWALGLKLALGLFGLKQTLCLPHATAYQKAVREQRLAAEIAAAKRERDFYLSRVDKAKAVAAQQERKRKVRPRCSPA